MQDLKDAQGQPVTIDTAVLDGACVDASALLYALAGRQFPGVCTATVRPMNWPYEASPGTALLEGLASGRMTLDSWTASLGGGAGDTGGIDLGLYPIRSIISVTIDGVVLDPATYRVDGQRWLIRPGLTFWPAWQRLDLPDSETGTFSVTATYGSDPPAHGVSAASKLAAEFAKERTDGLASSLPRQVTQIARQGVTVNRMDPLSYLTAGRLGIFEIDAFLRSVNPAQQVAPALVWSPELQRRRRV